MSTPSHTEIFNRRIVVVIVPYEYECEHKFLRDIIAMNQHTILE